MCDMNWKSGHCQRAQNISNSVLEFFLKKIDMWDHKAFDICQTQILGFLQKEIAIMMGKKSMDLFWWGRNHQFRVLLSLANLDFYVATGFVFTTSLEKKKESFVNRTFHHSRSVKCALCGSRSPRVTRSWDFESESSTSKPHDFRRHSTKTILRMSETTSVQKAHVPA